MLGEAGVGMRGQFGRVATALLGIAAMGGTAPAAAPPPISLQDSFRIGDDAGVLCRVQSQAGGAALKSMFDRGYAIVCRDAATAVGRLYAIRAGAAETLARLAALRAAQATCAAPARGAVDDLGAVDVAECTTPAGGVGYRVYALPRGRITYVAEGLAGYDSALRLGLRTIVADHAVPGSISAATTDVADPAAFARVQAGTLDLGAALAEGYRRNNSGSYAEAAEFFDALLTRAAPGEGDMSMMGEYVANRALQRSNLGEFAEADALFAGLTRMPTADPVQLRLRRNFVALHLLNQRRPGEALAELQRPVTPIAPPRPVQANAARPEIDRITAAELNSRSSAAQLGGDAANLTPEERAAILDAQARQMRGTILRLQGDLDGAQAALTGAEQSLATIREGRVSSITRLRVTTISESAAVQEARGDRAGAERLLRLALATIEAEYPRSAAANGQKARLAAFLARNGQVDAALAAYAEVVRSATEAGASTTGLVNLLSPYFALLAEQIGTRPALVADFFLAAETLVRPGVADTSAVLARELSGGSDEASRLFRQSVNLTREVERVRIDVARLTALAQPTADETARVVTLRAQLAGLATDQVATQAKLASYPRYRAVATTAMNLADLQAALRPGEAYWKLAIVGDTVYGIYATAGDATAYRAGFGGAAELDALVDTVRDSIAKEENGQLLTFPFDIVAARRLFVDLAGPVADRLARARSIVFEPDGAMLRLPINLLVTDDGSVASYAARQKAKGADEFDFTGTRWLGAAADISTAVSARAFRDTRRAAPSAAKRDYLGFGQNQPVSNVTTVSATRGMSGAGAVDCDWPLSEWNKPISARELHTAEGIIAKGRAGDAEVVTQAAFSDTAVIQRTDLDQFRILHFATHGLVTAPRPECPARPALLTSFGNAQSDGLLSFREIYDLKLDADLVILSACDTAGKATVAATREAGVTSGGGSALDGLVRAFVGAGGRSVVASHWPAPDDFGATGRLISGLFDARPGTSIAEALRIAELDLQKAPETSHPYYWSGFAIVGDGAQPVLRAR